MALSWVSAHEWSEQHTIYTDKELLKPNGKEIEKVKKEVEEETERYNFKQKELDNILNHCKKKLINFCLVNINVKFKMLEVTKDFPEVKSFHYKRLFELARRELELKGYTLSKYGKLWYMCTKG